MILFVPPDNTELKRLLERNFDLEQKNHRLLEKIHRLTLYDAWARALWFAVLIGAPVIVYYLFLEPYFKALGVNSEEFKVMVKNLPHLINTPWDNLINKQ